MKPILLLAATSMLAMATHAQEVFLTEDFEGDAIANGWSTSQDNNSVGWEFGTVNALSSQYWAIPPRSGGIAASNDDEYDNNSGALNLAYRDRLISPPIDLNLYPSARVSFSAYYAGLYGSLATVEVSDDGGDTWNEVFALPATEGWADYTVGFPGYTGEILVAFRHNDQYVWADGFALDDVSFFIPVPNDVAVTSINLQDFVLINEEFLLEGEITNFGGVPLTEVTISYSINGEAPQTHTFSDLNIAPLEVYTFSHPIGITLTTPEIGSVEVVASDPNGESDMIPDNNTAQKDFYGATFIAEKAVFIEEGTGTWCGWCPRGFVFMDFMAETYPETANLVAVHNADPMTNTAYDNAYSAMVAGYPSGHVDRFFLDVDPSEFPDLYEDRIGVIPAASIDVVTTFDEETRAMTATVKATFASNITRNYRLAAVVVEDGVTGTSSGYNQVNYYSGGDFGPMEGWEDLPDPVPAADMVYNHTGRAILGGFNGQSGSVPSSVEASGEYEYTFNYNVPSSFNETQIHVIGILIDQQTGTVVNSKRSENLSVSTNDLAPGITALNMFPNPANTDATLRMELDQNANVQISVLDYTGKQMLSRNYGMQPAGDMLYTLPVNNLANGVYMVQIVVNDKQVVRRLVVTH